MRCAKNVDLKFEYTCVQENVNEEMYERIDMCGIIRNVDNKCYDVEYIDGKIFKIPFEVVIPVKWRHKEIFIISKFSQFSGVENLLGKRGVFKSIVENNFGKNLIHWAQNVSKI